LLKKVKIALIVGLTFFAWITQSKALMKLM